ncbi:MAG TPA: VTT domain-containing protein [Chloroflexota bacterium]|jgi:membrane protein DedA with SNARE-associated domain
MISWGPSTADGLATAFYQYGILMVSLLLFLKAAGLPLPLPGDLLMLLIGSTLSQAGAPLWTAWIAFSAATFAGAMVLFRMVHRFGHRYVSDYGHYVGLTSARVEKAEDQIRRRGWRALTIGRMVPGLRLATAVAAATFGVRTSTFAWSAGVAAIAEAGVCLLVGATIGPSIAERFDSARLPLSEFLVLLIAGIAIGAVIQAIVASRHRAQLSRG